MDIQVAQEVDLMEEKKIRRLIFIVLVALVATGYFGSLGVAAAEAAPVAEISIFIWSEYLDRKSVV
jgi:hypothetical protein